MRTKLALTSMLVLGLASGAFADLVAATTVVDSFTGSGTFADNSVVSTGGASTINGVFAFDKSLTGGGAVPGTLAIDVFYPVNGAKGETSLQIFTGATTSAGVTV